MPTDRNPAVPDLFRMESVTACTYDRPDARSLVLQTKAGGGGVNRPIRPVSTGIGGGADFYEQYVRLDNE